MQVERLLVFQHLAVEHPGIFRDFLAADGIAWHAVELDRGDPIPDLRDYDALWVMGGPMDVWEEARYPWLSAEKCAIRRAVLDYDMPFMGICLGHQLLAAALGGEVRPGRPEIGVCEVELTEAGLASPFLKDLPHTLRCVQWHGAEITRTPAGSRVLARSPACAVQALAIGERTFSAQFHVEVTDRTIGEWNAVPAYRDALIAALGAGGERPFEAAALALMAEFNTRARRLYDNWAACARGAAAPSPPTPPS